MLKITIPKQELFDESKMEFITTRETTLQLEHSLVSLSKWESKWCKPFLSKEEKTFEETLDYIRCMTITQNVQPTTYTLLTSQHLIDINKYIESPMTATVFADEKNKTTNREVITAEIIYYWMISLNIPFECQKWHLNRLLTLINVCSIKNQPQKKMSRKEILERNRALNLARREAIKNRG